MSDFEFDGGSTKEEITCPGSPLKRAQEFFDDLIDEGQKPDGGQLTIQMGLTDDADQTPVVVIFVRNGRKQVFNLEEAKTFASCLEACINDKHLQTFEDHESLVSVLSDAVVGIRHTVERAKSWREHVIKKRAS